MKHLVIMMVGVVVDAETKEQAWTKASTPVQYGAIPGVIGVINTGCREAREDDTIEGFAKRMEK